MQHHLQKGGWRGFLDGLLHNQGIEQRHHCHGGKTEIHPGAGGALFICFPNAAQMRTSESGQGRGMVGYFRCGGLWDAIFGFRKDQLQPHRLCYRETREEEEKIVPTTSRN